jgi:hypothetical protein
VQVNQERLEQREHMQLVAISDTHGQHDAIAVPAGDVLIHVGDLTRHGELDELPAIAAWLARLPHRHTISEAAAQESSRGADRLHGRWRTLMAEYQYFEFLALDRPLTPAEIAEVRTLSSRVQPTPTQAVFTYSFGNFRGDPLQLLATSYDVLLHVANWGTKQLAFRLPQQAIDPAALQPYAFGTDAIALKPVGQHLILDIAFREEGGYDDVDGTGELASLAPLRADLLRGDLRALYLAWLGWAARAAGGPDDRDEDDEAVDPDALREPPVPPGLGQLSAALQAFVTFFAIDPDLVAAAAQASPPLTATREPVEGWVPLLPEAERNAFLVRAARGEAIGPELLRRLRAAGGADRPAPATQPPRTFAAIAAAANGTRQARVAQEREAAERARVAALEALARRAEQVWAEVPRLLALRTARGYDDAVAHLAQLRDLAEHQGQRAAFDARLARVIAPYAGSPALLRRLQQQRLTPPA